MDIEEQIARMTPTTPDVAVAYEAIKMLQAARGRPIDSYLETAGRDSQRKIVRRSFYDSSAISKSHYNLSTDNTFYINSVMCCADTYRLRYETFVGAVFHFCGEKASRQYYGFEQIG